MEVEAELYDRGSPIAPFVIQSGVGGMEYIVSPLSDLVEPTDANNTAQALYSFKATATSITLYVTANLVTADSDSFFFQVQGLLPWTLRNGMRTVGFQEIPLTKINGAVIGQTYVFKVKPREAGAQLDKFRIEGGLFVNGTGTAPIEPLLPPDLIAGKNTYDTQCIGCHGDMGKGATGPAITDTRTQEALTSFISANMPKNNPAGCVAQCAQDVAGYIKNGFSTLQSNEKFTLAEVNGDVKVEFIENCGVNSPAVTGKTYSFFNQVTNRIQGWSHVPSFPIEFATVKNGPMDPRYFIAEEKLLQPSSTASVVNDSTCNNQKTYGVILVRKYNTSGNMHGHSNGVEPRFPNENLTFSQLDSIVLEMKVDRKASNILSQAELQAQLGISGAQASNVDHGEITLKVYGYSPTGYGGQTAGTILRLNLDKYADKWIRVTIKTNGVGGATKLNQMVMYTMLWGDNLEAHSEGSPLTFKEIALNLKSYYMVLK